MLQPVIFSNLFFHFSLTEIPREQSTHLDIPVLHRYKRQSAQHKEVSITIDDIPNVHVYKQHGFSSPLLNQINELKLPVAIFINERNVYLNEFEKENRQGLVKWLTNKNITPGNHSYSHMNYSDTTLAAFKEDVVKGSNNHEGNDQKESVYIFAFPITAWAKTVLHIIR